MCVWGANILLLLCVLYSSPLTPKRHVYNQTFVYSLFHLLLSVPGLFGFDLIFRSYHRHMSCILTGNSRVYRTKRKGNDHAATLMNSSDWLKTSRHTV
jgi:hypothetical protein